MTNSFHFSSNTQFLGTFFLWNIAPYLRNPSFRPATLQSGKRRKRRRRRSGWRLSNDFENHVNLVNDDRDAAPPLSDEELSREALLDELESFLVGARAEYEECLWRRAEEMDAEEATSF